MGRRTTKKAAPAPAPKPAEPAEESGRFAVYDTTALRFVTGPRSSRSAAEDAAAGKVPQGHTSEVRGL